MNAALMTSNRFGIHPVGSQFSSELGEFNSVLVHALESDDEVYSEGGYNSSDEEATVWDEEEGNTDPDITATGSDEVLPGASTTQGSDVSNKSASQPTACAQQCESREQSLPVNKFTKALMDSVTSYSERLRVPNSRALLPKAPQAVKPEPSHEILSDESEDLDDENESGFSSDEFDDAELLSDRPTLSSQIAENIFYLPTNPWAGLADCPIENTEVLATLNDGSMCEAYIKQGTLDGRKITYISKTWRLSQEWSGFHSEIALYADSNYLRPLQGLVIPAIIGVYLVEGAISIAMQLPSSDFWVEASDDMSDYLKRRCISAFDQIHERGVLQNDVELRHMLVNSRGDVTIIDFQQSRALKPVEEVGLKAATQADLLLEKRLVRFKLDYKDSRAKEIEKVNRAAEREERKERIRTGHTNCTSASEQDNTPVVADEDSEPEDPDDVLNRVVDPKTWKTKWLGAPFTPSCFIVPERDRDHIASAIEEFVMEEFDRQDKDRIRHDGDNLVPDNQAKAGTNPSPPSHAPTPILPTLINLKRSREDSDEASDAAPSPKKRLSNPLWLLRDSKTFTASRQPPSDAAKSTSDTSGHSDDLGSPTVANAMAEEPVVPEIYVPFEGYTDSDGFTLRNVISPHELSMFRRNWIRQYNRKRCIQEGLPYPTAEMYNLVPSTQPPVPFRITPQGKRKKRRLRLNRGTLRRRQIDKEDPERRVREAEARKEEYFRNRKEPGTGLSDSEDDEDGQIISAYDGGIPEGGKILSWHEFEESIVAGNLHSSVYSFNFPELAPTFAKPSTPSKGILRRHLTSSDKARNFLLLELYDKRRREEEESDTGDEADTDSDPKRSAKRARTGSSPLPVQNTSPSKSNGGTGFEKYAAAPNAFAVRSGSRNKATSGYRFPFLSGGSSNHTAASLSGQASSTETVRSNSSRSASPSGNLDTRNQYSARSSASASSLSGILSDSESESDGDQEPSSSVSTPPRRRRHRRSRSSSGSGPRPCAYREITLEELNERRTLGRSLNENAGEAKHTKQQPVIDKAERPWGGFRFSFPWRWPTFR